jgi:hypothetical protein
VPQKASDATLLFRASGQCVRVLYDERPSKCKSPKASLQFELEETIKTPSLFQCVVQPYLQWLEDSSFKSKCSLCQLNLANEECLRLLCYRTYFGLPASLSCRSFLMNSCVLIADIFHLSCLNKYGASFPATTAPAGFSCPDCRSSIFPTSSSPSPIFAVLKKRLGSAEWARAGLGLPVLNAVAHNSSNHSSSSSTSSNLHKTAANAAQSELQTSLLAGSVANNIKIYASSVDQSKPESSTVPISVNQLSNYIHLNVDQNSSSSSSPYSTFSSSARRTAETHGYDPDSRPLLVDIDEDKYRQKSAVERARQYLKYVIVFLLFRLRISLWSCVRLTDRLIDGFCMAFFSTETTTSDIVGRWGRA